MCAMASVHCSIQLLLLVVTGLLINDVYSYPTGAPSCTTLTPKHDPYFPQPNPAPYTVSVSSDSVVAGQSLVVTVSPADTKHPGEKNFMGFQLRAVDSTSGDVVGNFLVDSSETLYHTLSCGNSTRMGGITHSSNSLKPSVQLTWIAPTDIADTAAVIFTASVVKQYTEFWVGIKSVPVALMPGVSSPSPRSTSSLGPTTAQPPSPRSMSSLGPTTAQPPSGDIYAGCGTTKSCFGMPGGDKCIKETNCDVLVTFVKRHAEELLDFELIGAVGSNHGFYVAVAFSMDQFMGDDSVRECVIKPDGITGSESFNMQTSPNSNKILAPMDLTANSFTDGALSCKFTVSPRFAPLNVSFDLFSHNYYLLLAIGQMDATGEALVQHTARLASALAFNFTAIETSPGTSINTLVALHGCLMVVAWVGTVSVAIFMARYYKQMWPETTLCKVKVWFACHRGLNTFAVLMTVSASVIMVIHVKGISSEWPANPHPLTGGITIILMLLQPIMALFRCDPGASRRPIFNWLHFLVGMIAVILALVTMFYAVTLRSIQLPQYFWWILIAYVAFFVITFANMEFFTCIAARSGEKESIAMHNYPVSGGGNVHAANPLRGGYMLSSDGERQARFKQVMLILFVAGAVGFSAALVVVIATS